MTDVTPAPATIQIMARTLWKQHAAEGASWDDDKSEYFKTATKVLKALEARGLVITQQAS